MTVFNLPITSDTVEMARRDLADLVKAIEYLACTVESEWGDGAACDEYRLARETAQRWGVPTTQWVD